MKNFTKITVLGLVFALALGSANCKKDSEDNTGTMLLLLSLLNQSSCGKLDYSLGYFMAQVAPPEALQGVGGYPWSYDSCKPTYSQNGSVPAIGSITIEGGTTTTYTYTSGYLSKKVVKGSAYIAAGSAGYDGVDGAMAAGTDATANCPSNRTGTNRKVVEVLGTTTYTRDASNNVTTEETKYTCGGNNVTAFAKAYAKKVITYNTDNRILTLKYYVNSDRTYNINGASTTAAIQDSYVNTSGANPVATLDYTYTPSSGIPTEVKIVGKSYYMSINGATSTAVVRAASTTAVDEITWTFKTSAPGVLSSATYTESCNSVASTATTTSTALLASFTSTTTATNCGPTVAAAPFTTGVPTVSNNTVAGVCSNAAGCQTLGAWSAYGDSATAATAGGATQDVRTVTITLTNDTKKTDRLASYKVETVTKSNWTATTTAGTAGTTTTKTSTSTLSYDSNGRLNKKVTVSNNKYVNATAVTCTTALTPDAGACDGTSNDSRTVATYSYNGNGLGVFAGAETFSTATSDEQTAQPTLWNVK